MHISIAERLRPFSHLPGTSTILTGCGYQVQIFPCLIRIYQLKSAQPFLVAQFSLELKGPVEQFTVCNDLEKGCITVSGKTSAGWLRYDIVSSKQDETIRLIADRTPSSGLSIAHEHSQYLLRDHEWLDLWGSSSLFEPYRPFSCDRLSLGNHKAQDWEWIKRRLNLAEIFPLWHRLGQLIPSYSTNGSKEGTLALLEACRKSLIDEMPDQASQHWTNLIKAGFNSLLTPQLEDRDYQGFIPNSPFQSLDISPLVILTEGSRLIRQLFFQQQQEQIAILPYLLPSLHCGRLIHVPLDRGGWISLEWTKKTIRRLMLFVEQDQELAFKFRSNVRSYRLRHHLQDKGERKNSRSSLFLKKNCHYFFDNFN